MRCIIIPVPPDTPQIGYNGTSISVGKNLTSQSGQRASVKCISRNGNPAPLLKWFVGKQIRRSPFTQELYEFEKLTIL